MAQPQRAGRPQHVPLPVAAGAGREQLAGYIADVEPMVRSICRSRLGRDRGDDAAQKVLLKIWEDLQPAASSTTCAPTPRCRPRSRPGPKPTREAVPVGDKTDLWADQVSASPAEEYLRAEDAGEAAQKVAALLDRLTPREVQVVRARSLQERPTTEVAAELGITPKSRAVGPAAGDGPDAGDLRNPLAEPARVQPPHGRTRTDQVAADQGPQRPDRRHPGGRGRRAAA